MQYQINWSDKYHLAQKLEKIQKISHVLQALSSCDNCPAESVSFLASEINSLSSDLSQVVARVERVGAASAFDGDSDIPI